MKVDAIKLILLSCLVYLADAASISESTLATQNPPNDLGILEEEKNYAYLKIPKTEEIQSKNPKTIKLSSEIQANAYTSVRLTKLFIGNIDKEIARIETILNKELRNQSVDQEYVKNEEPIKQFEEFFENFKNFKEQLEKYDGYFYFCYNSVYPICKIFSDLKTEFIIGSNNELDSSISNWLQEEQSESLIILNELQAKFNSCIDSLKKAFNGFILSSASIHESIIEAIETEKANTKSAKEQSELPSTTTSNPLNAFRRNIFLNYII